MNVQIFNYKESAVTFFNKEGNLMVNATQMAEPFGKRVKDWLKNKQTTQLINTISDGRIIPSAELVKVIKGGNKHQGTWLHEDLALVFAQWLSPHFYLWCNDRIKELLQHGATAVNPNDLLDPDYVIGVLTALKKERSLKAAAQQKIEDDKHKVSLAESICRTDNSILIRDYAKRLSHEGFEIGQNRLFKWLRENGYLMRDNTPYQQYVAQDLFEVVVRTRRDDKGGKSFSTTMVTGKGQLYFADKLKN